jgi:hypothetical protein
MPNLASYFPNIENLSFVGDDDTFDPEHDIILVPEDFNITNEDAEIFTAYKTVDKKN